MPARLGFHWGNSYKLVYRLHGPMIRRCEVSSVALRNACSDRARVLVRDNEINRLSDRPLPGLNVRRRIALKGRRALHSQGCEAAHESRLHEDALGMPGVVHVPHEQCRLAFTHASRELVGNSLELPHPRRHPCFAFIVVPGTREMSGRDENRLLRSLDLKADPKHPPLRFDVTDFLGTMLHLL